MTKRHCTLFLLNFCVAHLKRHQQQPGQAGQPVHTLTLLRFSHSSHRWRGHVRHESRSAGGVCAAPQSRNGSRARGAQLLSIGAWQDTHLLGDNATATRWVRYPSHSQFTIPMTASLPFDWPQRIQNMSCSRRIRRSRPHRTWRTSIPSTSCSRWSICSSRIIPNWARHVPRQWRSWRWPRSIMCCRKWSWRTTSGSCVAWSVNASRWATCSIASWRRISISSCCEYQLHVDNFPSLPPTSLHNHNSAIHHSRLSQRTASELRERAQG